MSGLGAPATESRWSPPAGTRVLVMMPGYNEERNIGPSIAAVRRDAPYADILVVDDGSRDATSRVAREAGAMVVPLPVNLGIFDAIHTAFIYAHRAGYDAAVQVDADGQHQPSEIPAILVPVLKGEADVVIGSRYLEDRGYRTPVSRRLGMILFAGVTSLLIGRRVTDTTCGFRAYSREAIAAFAQETGVEALDAVGLVILGRAGYRISEVPATVHTRLTGKSSINFLRSLVYPFNGLLSLIPVLLNRKYVKARPTR
ncbi:MAG: glycosyltransferase family 2 protein [Candidatus Eisenbacteria bacterium]|nr:glycosyltransferase family 2 protein [Candidatus Eisenbacteria bacterium]